MLTIEHRQSIYDQKIKTLMNIGRIDDEEMKTLIEQLNNVMFFVDEVENEENEETDNDHSTDQPIKSKFF
jgi:Asp-tRNA(Asn)/Glu-tRNA(Gln) amidotransferase C subunit